jgi:hypothetical protein
VKVCRFLSMSDGQNFSMAEAIVPFCNSNILLLLYEVCGDLG